MVISSQCVNLIKTYEGYRSKSYKCPAGVWTIGYGHTKGVKEGDTCTIQQAEQWIYEDCSNAVKEVNKYMSVYNFNQSQYDALVSFAYNIGSIKQLTANGSRTIQQISSKMLEYNKANGVVLAGLTARRKSEQTLFNLSTPSINVKSNNDIALEVIRGKWGVGETRKKRLTQAGYNYNEIQKLVNQM